MQLTIKTDPLVDADMMFENFKHQHNINYVLAFSGGADDQNHLVDQAKTSLMARLPQEYADAVDQSLEEAKNSIVDKLIRDTLAPLRGYKLAILTGGTKWGIPKIATSVAKEYGFKTIGVFPLTAEVKKYSLGDNLLDLSICVHPGIGQSRWGDESPHFTRCLNGMIIIGGGAGTMVEVSHLLKRNERTDVPPKIIIPIIGTGGTADRVMSFPGKPLTMSKCLPLYPITDGNGVSEYLRRHVFFEDMYN